MGPQKYPRTPHLPWSPGGTDDDRRLTRIDHFVDREVVVTEKLDGECTTMHPGGCYARSVESGPHPSRTYVKALAGRIQYQLRENEFVIGENCYAEHSIHYAMLPDYLMVFAIRRDRDYLSWDETFYRCKALGLAMVPVLYRGIWNEQAISSCFTGMSRCGGSQEGYVVRLAVGFREGMRCCESWWKTCPGIIPGIMTVTRSQIGIR